MTGWTQWIDLLPMLGLPSSSIYIKIDNLFIDLDKLYGHGLFFS